MRKEDTVRLDTHALLRRIEDRRFKQSWIADRVGVSRKTVSRWVTGKVKRAARESAEALCEVLDCALADITVPDEADVMATKAEQRTAARLIQRDDLLQLLSPTDRWALAESLIRATLQPDLPLRDLGRLYNLLSIASWRQGRYDDGARHAARAREIGERIDDRPVVQAALYNRAVIDSLCGDLGAALAGYEQCLAVPEAFETRRDHAKVLSNVGDVHRAFLRFDESMKAQRASLRLFAELGLDLNLAIGEVSLGAVLCESGRFEEAEAAYARGEESARRAGYARGVDCAPIYRADPTTLLDRRAEARELVLGALPALARHEIYDLGCHQIAARVLRRAGDLVAAAAQVAAGRRKAARFPEPRAMILLEAARLALARGDAAGEVRAREEANAAFREAGLEVRVLEGPVREHGLTDPRRSPPTQA